MLIQSMEIIRRISRSYLEASSANGSISFKRFTQKQYKAYDSSEVMRIRSLCPSGVSFDFYTDSDFIRFKYTVLGKSRDWMFFDIYIDNVFVHTIGQEPVEEYEGEVQYNIPGEKGKMRRLTIYLPHLVDITLKDIEISDNSHIEEVKAYDKSILCLGDSITQGMNGLHPSTAYPVQLARYFEMNLLNHGVAGYVFGKDSLDEEMQYNPDIITVAYGTNDWRKCESIEQFSKNVEDYMEKLTQIYPKAFIYIITPIWRADMDLVRASGTFEGIIQTIIKICSKYQNVQIIDGFTLVPHMPSYFGDAKVHPNDEGFMHYSMGLIRVIDKHV